MNNITNILTRYDVGITALQEIRWLGTGEIPSGGYTIFYSCHETQHTLGVGFAVSKEVLASVVDFQPINERMCTLRVKGKWFNITFINVHAPTEDKEDEEKDAFYTLLEEQFDRAPRHDVKIVLGDLNAKVGREAVFRPHIGLHGLHATCNDNGLRLVSFASSKNLVIASTVFPHRDIHKGTWRSPDGQTVNQIDHVLIDRRHASAVQDVRAWRGADCDSDHSLVTCRLAMRICNNPIDNGRRPPQRPRFNVEALTDAATALRYQEELRNRFEALPLDEADVDTAWEHLRDATLAAATSTVGMKERQRSRKWFDGACAQAVENRRQARLKALQRPDHLESQEAYTTAQRVARNLLKAKKRRFLTSLVEELERESRGTNSRKFFRRLKTFRRGFQPNQQLLRAADGSLITDPIRILQEWTAYFEQLLNCPAPDDPLPHPVDDQDDVQQDVPPISLEEVRQSVNRLKSWKACGTDDIPGEFWKCGGDAACIALHRLITKIWELERLPDQWKEALIIALHKKGDRKLCAHYRGISLLCTAYKVLSNILLQRLSPLVEDILGEYQCGFRKNRSTIDQIFTLRQILEKRREHNLAVHNVFVDFQKAYDSIHRDGLYTIMAEFGIPQELVKMAAICLDGVRSRVQMGNRRGDPFGVNTGLRQGDGLSPLLFNLVLEWVVRRIENVRGGVNFGGPIKTLGYADDLDNLGDTREDVRRCCGELLAAAKRVGLEVNESKTEYLVMSRDRQAEDENPLEVDGLHFRSVTEFRYLGSTVTHDNDTSYEINARIQGGNRCLYALGHLFRSKSLSRHAKLRIYNSVIRPIVLYACETWNLTVRAQERLLTFENRVLRRILGPNIDPVTGRVRVKTNDEIRRLTGQPFITSVIKSRRLRWAGHVARAPPTRAIRRVLDNRPTSPRPQGRPRLRWADNVSRDAGRLGVPDWRAAAENRTAWRKVCDAALGLQAL